MTTWPWNSRDTAVICRRECCGKPYTQHEPGGGPCKARDCKGFQWVNPESAPGENQGYARS